MSINPPYLWLAKRVLWKKVTESVDNWGLPVDNLDSLK